MIDSIPSTTVSLVLPNMSGVGTAGVADFDTHDFSSLLKSLIPGMGEPVTVEAPTPLTVDPAKSLPSPGIVLPLAAKAGGRILPDAAAAPDDTADDAATQQANDGSDTEQPAAPAIVPVAVLELPLPIAPTGEPAAKEPANDRSPLPAGLPPQAPTPAVTGPAPSSTDNKGAVQIALATNSSAGTASEDAATAPVPLRDTLTAALPPLASEGVGGGVPASLQPSITVGTSPTLASSTATGTTAQDVARIVEQLSAARAAIAPATAALSVDHADFGEISVRFDQRADGALAVQLGTSNGEAQRAISAALAAQGGQLSSHDGQSSSQPQQQQTPSGSAAARDERGTGGQPSAQRQDQPFRNPQPRHAPRSGESRDSGIFA